MKYRLDIQGLRALAVLVVLLFHLNKDIMPGGFIGVDMFFVISGFLISSIILRQKEKGAFSFKGFYAGRIKRIVPAYYVMIIVAVIALAIVNVYLFVPFQRAATSSALFLSNMYLPKLDTYFGASASENPFLHTWTLSLEMQFYLLLPLIIMLFSKKNLKYVIVPAIVLLLAYCQYNQMVLGRVNQMYYSLGARIPEFLLGVSINLFSSRVREHFKAKNNLYAVIGLMMIAASLFLINGNTLFPGLTALLPCVGTCLLLLSEGSLINRAISHKVPVYIGEISYSLYLWHWPVFAIMRFYNNDYHFGFWEGCLLLAVVMAISVMSYHFIEKPLRNLKGKKFVIMLGAISVVLAVTINGMSWRAMGAGDKFPARYGAPSGLGLKNHGQTDADNKLQVIGTPGGRDTIFLFGDSHALVYRVFFDKLGKSNNFALKSMTNDKYPTMPGINKNDIDGSYARERYEKYTKIACDNIEDASVIVFAMNWESAGRFSGFADAVDDFIKGLSPTQQVIFLGDFPVSDSNPIRKYRDLVRQPGKEYPFPLKIDEIPEDIREVIGRYDNAHIHNIDFGDFFQDAPFYRDTVMYYDKNHLNGYAAEQLANACGGETMLLLNQYLPE